MGAEEKAEPEAKTIEVPNHTFEASVLEKLNAGWCITERESDGQLLLVQPPAYGEPD